MAPKGSNDPFALRRAALHIIENLVSNGKVFDVRAGLAAALELLPLTAGNEVLDEVQGFVNGRLDGVLREKGYPASVVKAVLAAQGHNPYAAMQTAAALHEASQQPDWSQLLDAYARCVRITRTESVAYELRPAAFGLDAEKNLYAAYETAVRQQNGTLPAFVTALRDMVPAINHFFDEVLVMDEDPDVRANRLALLQHIAALPQGVADLTEMEGF